VEKNIATHLQGCI